MSDVSHSNLKELGRVNCLISGCRRTRKKDFQNMEWICQKHWSVVPKKYRKLYSLAKRRYKKMLIDEKRVSTIWSKCKDQAIMNAWCV